LQKGLEAKQMKMQEAVREMLMQDGCTHAVSLVVGLAILTLILSGIEPALKMSKRIDDGNLQARLVSGNGV